MNQNLSEVLIDYLKTCGVNYPSLIFTRFYVLLFSSRFYQISVLIGKSKPVFTFAGLMWNV